MNGRILVAEDEPQIRQYVADILAGFPGIEVAYAANGEAALDLLPRQDWDLVISDHRMGPTDGVVVLHEAERVLPHAQRMMMTGYAELSLVADAKNGAHVHRFLAKPFTPGEFAKAVRDLLDHARREKLRLGAFHRALETTAHASARE